MKARYGLVFAMSLLSSAWALVGAACGIRGVTDREDQRLTGRGEEASQCFFGRDGVCDLGVEDCSCVDCADIAICRATEDRCRDDATCDVYDACVCGDCFRDPGCILGCNEDGVCDAFTEGCSCGDCADQAECKLQQAKCIGGSPDGSCSNKETESCDCPDCRDAPRCLAALCTNDGACAAAEPCSCVDCRQDPVCSDRSRCADVAGCNLILEGCVCPECESWDLCMNAAGGSSSG